MSTLAELLNPDILESLQTLKQELPTKKFSPKEKEPSNTVEQLTSHLNRFFEESERGAEIQPILDYYDKSVGMSERIKLIVAEHFGSSLPVLHFTNAAVGNDIENLISTGFAEKFTEQGSKGKLHVGAFRRQDVVGGPFKDMTLDNSTLFQTLEKARKIGIEFHHHGTRTNKNQLGGSRESTYSLPALVVMDKPETLERGVDNYDHWIVPSSRGSEKIVTIILLNPERAFSRPLVKNRKNQNEFLTDVIHGLGLYRLNQIHQRFLHSSGEEKDQLALYAHDLVDGYLVSKEDYKKLFDIEHFEDKTKDEISKREADYNFFDRD